MARKSGAVLERPLEKRVTKSTCQHHWLIDAAIGPTSKGCCRICGEERIFLNIVEDLQPKESLSRFFDKDELADEGDELGQE